MEGKQQEVASGQSNMRAVAAAALLLWQRSGGAKRFFGTCTLSRPPSRRRVNTGPCKSSFSIGIHFSFSFPRGKAEEERCESYCVD